MNSSELTDADIHTARRNAVGVNADLFVPNAAFEVLNLLVYAALSYQYMPHYATSVRLLLVYAVLMLICSFLMFPLRCLSTTSFRRRRCL
jgi:hypothetical protein